jgi:two-component system alkaline phosphatase synthesis response regulator PhoP
MVKKTILVVEDEEDVQELIAFNLTRHGYRVKRAMTGTEALQTVRDTLPDLVILDLMLPELDGLTVCKTLKTDATTRDIPIIMVTAKAEDADMIVGLEMGADDYLPKPFSPGVLVSRVRAQLRRKTHYDNSERQGISIHELVIHPGRHELTVNGNRIDLSYTEFQILLCLVQSPGWVHSRYQLVNKVRGDEVIVTDRTIDVHVANLRKKLGEYGRYIETVRGAGYRFRE